MPNATIVDSVNTETFKVMNGLPQPLEERIQDITRPIEDGHWIRRIGQRSDEFTFVGVTTVADSDAAQTKILTSYPAMLAGASKELVTLTDNLGKTWSNVLLINFEVLTNLESPTIGGVVTASDGQVLITRWRARIAQ